jgi:hypothetical protein
MEVATQDNPTSLTLVRQFQFSGRILAIDPASPIE